MRTPVAVAAFILLATSLAHAKTLEDLLIEKGVITRAEAKSTSQENLPVKAYWNQGTRLEFPDAGFTASFALFLQERYTFTDADEDAGRKNASSFEQKRARIIVRGTALNEEFEYFMQSDFVGEKDGTENVPGLKDAFVVWNVMPKLVSLKMGQYKSFVSRQWNASDAKTLMPDRSLASEYFHLDRQQGASAQLVSPDKIFEFKAGIFNGLSTGEGINRPGLDTREQGDVAVRVNPNGPFDPYEESDVGYSEDLGTSFGAAYSYGEARQSVEDASFEEHIQRVSVDANAKYHGMSLNGEFFWGKEEAAAGDTTDPIGFYVQAGCFLTPKRLELAGRFSMVDCDDGGAWGACRGNSALDETTVALNYYFWKHFLKATLAYVNSGSDAESAGVPDINTNKWMFQLSSYF